jgi:hypothetical protein
MGALAGALPIRVAGASAGAAIACICAVGDVHHRAGFEGKFSFRVTEVQSSCECFCRASLENIRLLEMPQVSVKCPRMQSAKCWSEIVS